MEPIPARRPLRRKLLFAALITAAAVVLAALAGEIVARARGIPAATIAVNFGQARLDNGPWDPHPSAEAHRLYARKLLAFLVEEGLVDG